MLDADLTAFLRLTLALFIFLPFLRPGKLTRGTSLRFALVGALQYGLMYMLLNASYAYLSGWQVALMTLMTPIYLVIFDGLWKRRMDPLFLLAAVFAALGAGLVMTHGKMTDAGSLRGCLLVQGSDICFAIGLLYYRTLRAQAPEQKDSHVFALLFSGAALFTGLFSLYNGSLGEVSTITARQWAALLYMGSVSSGLCLFWWNIGSTKVSTGMLAAVSNLKVPMAVVVSILLFGEKAGHWPSLIVGSAVMLLGVVLAGGRKSGNGSGRA